ncbi:MAG: hypothetical protein IKH32_03860 [Prevotella sp.]|nr:hypothetical protein [Prevotella sp.]MBR3479826.1 hypothetical protein [Prevotella sp.]
MWSFKKPSTIFHCAAAALLLAMLTSCQWMKEDLEDQIADNSASRYINITVSVSASNEAVTRATPLGGETGDGLEKGNDRENKVNNITLIFYEDNAGINTTNSGTKVAFFATYPVTEVDNYQGTHEHNLDNDNIGWTGTYQESDDNEVIYSTGDQLLEESTIDVTKTYHAIVVANAPTSLLASIKVNETSIADVRDMVVSAVYDGNGVGTNASNFVMSSERDATVTFTNRKTDAEKNTITYYFECIHIERLSARIDFWAKTKDPNTSNIVAAEYKAAEGDIPAGYRYNVGVKNDDNQDFFVLTRITPFNLMNDVEYLLKRTKDGTEATNYLAKETATSWVLDPYSAQDNQKNSKTAHPDYLTSKLNDVCASFINSYTIALSDCQTASTATAEGTKFSITESSVTADGIILNYPKENTLRGNVSPLYYYATGLAFEGYYFKAGSTTGERRVFYHYLRHQGEQDVAYQALTSETLSNTTLCSTTPAMNYGIVRNNIYRVSIESITPDVDDELYVKLLIKVKKWDKYVHTPIYM